MAKSGYDVYLDKCLLPVTPEQIQTRINNENVTVTLINEGQVNLLKKAGLTDIEFECMIPQVRYPFAVYKDGFKDSGYYTDYFEQLKTSRKPFQFIVSRFLPDGRSLFGTNIKVSMEDYKITESAGNGFDLMVKVKLKQYCDYATKTINIVLTSAKPQAAVQTERPAGNAPSGGSYTVVKGDCLWNIAKSYYGNGSKWQTIYNANRQTIGGNPNLIKPGQVLTIPPA